MYASPNPRRKGGLQIQYTIFFLISQWVSKTKLSHFLLSKSMMLFFTGWQLGAEKNQIFLLIAIQKPDIVQPYFENCLIFSVGLQADLRSYLIGKRPLS